MRRQGEGQEHLFAIKFWVYLYDTMVSSKPDDWICMVNTHPKRGYLERERMLWRGGEVRQELSLKLDRVINQFDFFHCT